MTVQEFILELCGHMAKGDIAPTDKIYFSCDTDEGGIISNFSEIIYGDNCIYIDTIL